MSTRGIYRYHLDCGRMGDVFGLFAATDTEIAESIGKRLYFGEILGKHSEICGTLDAHEVTLISAAPADVEVFDRLNLTTGHSPLDGIAAAEESAG